MSIKKCGVIVSDRTLQEVLLVKGKKSQKWGFPKGHMEMGESEEETAVRELLEETGIHWTQSLQQRVRFRNNVYFLVDAVKSEMHCHINDVNEIEKVGWFSVDDIYKFPEYQCNFGLKNWIKQQRDGPLKTELV